MEEEYEQNQEKNWWPANDWKTNSSPSKTLTAITAYVQIINSFKTTLWTSKIKWSTTTLPKMTSFAVKNSQWKYHHPSKKLKKDN